jgi:hypothetical protein
MLILMVLLTPQSSSQAEFKQHIPIVHTLAYAGRRVHYAATEIKASARAVLLQHPAGFRHLFGDIMERVPLSQRAMLKDISSDFLGRFRTAEAEHNAGSLSTAEFHGLKDALGVKFLADLRSHLDIMEFEHKAWCYIHLDMCYISPRFAPDTASSIWAEAAGNTCCPWSSMSPGSMWLDSATLPFLVSRGQTPHS